MDCWVMKTIEMYKVFNILNTFTGFLFIMFSFMPLNMTSKGSTTLLPCIGFFSYVLCYIFEDDSNVQSSIPFMTFIGLLLSLSFIYLESTVTCKMFTTLLIFMGFLCTVCC